MNASGWWAAALDLRRQRRKGQQRIDPPVERVTDDAAQPRVHDRGQIDEAAENGDVGEIGDPELFRAFDIAVSGVVREDGLAVIAVGCGDEAPPTRYARTTWRLKAMLWVR